MRVLKVLRKINIVKKASRTISSNKTLTTLCCDREKEAAKINRSAS